MQEYSPDIIFEFLNDINAVANEIALELKKDDSEKEISKNISGLYNKRKDKLVIINNWVNSDEGKLFINNNKEQWNKLIGHLVEKDGKNLELVKAKVRGLSADILTLYKKKNALKIYTKEKR